jgi:GT2 family glycosyltransferase
MNHVGIVIIGRNEGERLRRCLDSVVGRGHLVVYVDSGSTDGSVALARAMGAEVVALDLSRPFTAARARNTGFARLEQVDPGVAFVQFVDGDCELVDGWLQRACTVLETQPGPAVVSGRLKERFPERSIYNRLADLEFDMPAGEAKYCGGIAMMRAEAFRQVGGFNAGLIAGEEPDLCVRLRQQGWTVLQIDAEIALHDMAMTQFRQWWRRCERTGYTYAEGCARYSRSPERHFVRQTQSTIFWGIVVPLLAVGLAWPTRGASLLLLGSYLFLYWRIRRYGSRRGWAAAAARLYALWCILAKFPMVIGLIIYWFRQITHRPTQIIEYKGANTATSHRDFSASVCDGTN